MSAGLRRGVAGCVYRGRDHKGSCAGDELFATAVLGAYHDLDEEGRKLQECGGAGEDDLGEAESGIEAAE